MTEKHDKWLTHTTKLEYHCQNHVDTFAYPSKNHHHHNLCEYDTLVDAIWRLLYFWIMFTRKRKSKSVEEDHVCLGGPLFYFATFCKRRRSFQTSHFIRYFFHEEVHSAFLSRAIQMYVTLPKDAMPVGCLNVPKV